MRQVQFPLRDRLAARHLIDLWWLGPIRNDPGGAAARMWKVLAKYFPELPKPVHVDGLMFWLRNRDGLVVPLPSLSARARREPSTVRAKRLGTFSRQSSTVTRAMGRREYEQGARKCPAG